MGYSANSIATKETFLRNVLLTAAKKSYSYQFIIAIIHIYYFTSYLIGVGRLEAWISIFVDEASGDTGEEVSAISIKSNICISPS